jgi:hypothetical protein
MSPRVLLLVLILSASATFVVGVALERPGETSHHETRAESTTQRAQSATGEQAEGGESATAHAAKAGNSATHGTSMPMPLPNCVHWASTSRRGRS